MIKRGTKRRWYGKAVVVLCIGCMTPALYQRASIFVHTVRAWCVRHVVVQEVRFNLKPVLEQSRHEALTTWVTSKLSGACMFDVQPEVFVTQLRTAFPEVLDCSWFLTAQQVLYVTLRLAEPIARIDEHQVLASNGFCHPALWFEPQILDKLLAIKVHGVLTQQQGTTLATWIAGLDPAVAYQFVAHYYSNSYIKLFSKETQKYCLLVDQRTMVSKTEIALLEQIIRDMVARGLIKQEELQKPRVRVTGDLRFDRRVIVSCEGTKAWGVGYEKQRT